MSDTAIDRLKRIHDFESLLEYLVIALRETIRLMEEIDAVIEDHGGWPGAFQPAKVGS
ncbi:MAG: hypothetical protein ACYDAK_14260 [Candidatus Limnocylindrales bacterium]